MPAPDTAPPGAAPPCGALIAIDLQVALFDGARPPDEADAVLQRVRELAARARAAGVPVLWVQHTRPDTPLAAGSAGWQLLPALAAEAADIRLHKTTPDAFLRTGLAEWLAQRGIGHVAVCGYASEFCVDTTVRRAAALGLAVTLAADAHTTHDQPHAAARAIRAHANATLPALTSFDVPIRAQPAADIAFAPATARFGAPPASDAALLAPAPAGAAATRPQAQALLDARYGTPGEAALQKVSHRLTPAYRQWLQASPFVVLATSGPGGLDASPRGDAAPVLAVLDDRTLLLPDRRGNQRLDSLRNLLHDDRVALLALVPGTREAMRIHGRAHLSHDAALCRQLAVDGREPASVLVLRIAEVYFQCARAVLRAGLWATDGPARAAAAPPSAGALLAEASGGRIDGAAYDAALPARQRDSLY